ncbi:DUF1517 domain-containing protein [Thermoleptolyngbya sp. M55_K2018_002]|uniref:DUF1517 domain-containing protein n=1 Tax=Thermoleptolyngbya sp. M55_K2018_002 TaxID=2747808 RepID=UPI001A08AE1C|nr:DUF1517 domain-containing protein [Thermoleptolyngbya sp. M55_K2018_002]HIK42695.1 DUF1517 domain-containing protein [Thermoleptolyngbya sp. M55_K2018_002]
MAKHMTRFRKIRQTVQFGATTLLALVLVNGLSVDGTGGLSGREFLTGNPLRQGFARRAEAASGGRYRGGTFNRPSGGGSAGGGYSGGGYSGGGYSGGGYSGGYGGGYTSPDYFPVPGRYYPPPGPIYIPSNRPPVIVAPGGGYVTPVGGGGGGGLFLLFFLLPAGLMIFSTVMSAMQRTGRSRIPAARPGRGELENDIVTVTLLQVALLSQARYIQERLNQLVAGINTDTKAGLSEALRETVLVLLRSPENWTHARALSKTVSSREEAARLFEQWSIEERGKFTSETLVNVGGKVRRQPLDLNPNDDPAAYIVVTLIVGTEDDRLLFGPIHTVEELKLALRRLGAIPPEYLAIYELLWTPQDPTDSLSREELLTGYADMVQV